MDRFQGTELREYGYTTEDQISVMYLGQPENFVSWTVTNGTCTIANASLPVSTLRCEYPGIYGIQPTTVSSGEEIQYIDVKHSPFCFYWQAATVSSADEVRIVESGFESLWNNGSDRFVVHVWVADRTELNGGFPNQRSAELSREFHFLGEKPVMLVSLIGSLRRAHEPLNIGFNMVLGVWEFIVKNQKETESLILYTVVGRSQSLKRCFIRDTLLTLESPPINSLVSIRQIVVTYNGDGQVVMADNCNGNLALLLYRNIVVLTSNGFVTVETFTIDSSSLEEDLQTLALKNVVFTKKYIVLLDNTGALFAVDKYTLATQQISTDVFETVLGIGARGSCALGEMDPAYSLFNGDDFVYWTSTSIVIRRAYERRRRVLRIPNIAVSNLSFSPFERRITSVRINPIYDIISVLVLYSDGTSNASVVFLYNFKEETWSNACSLSEVSGGDMDMRFVSTAKVRLVIWNSNHLFLYDERLSVLSLDEGQFSAADSNIETVITNNNGEILIKTSANRLYYTYVYNPTAPVIEVSTGESSDGEFVIWCNALGTPYVIKRVDGEWQMRRLALRQALYSVSHPHTKCPYRYFNCPVHNRILYLDIGETAINISATLTFDRNTVLDLLHFVHPIPGVTIIHRLKVTKYSGHKQIDQTFTIQPQLNVEQNISQEDYATALFNANGPIGIEFWVNNSHVMCPPPAITMSVVKAGCPRARHIRVVTREEDETFCAQFRNYSYTIPRDKLRSTADLSLDEDLVVQYDYASFGCPIRMHNSEEFVPRIALYDEDIFIKEVDANFVVWEEYGQLGFKYNTTMFNVRCRQMAHTWEALMLNANPSNQSLGHLWGPWNHRNCFETPTYNMTAVELKLMKKMEYQILNSTGATHIQLPKDRDRIFVLNVQVVEPGFSYCTLNTRFAISVEGAIPDPNIMVIGLSLLVFICLMATILVSSYMYLHVKMYGDKDFEFARDEYDSD